MCRNSRPLESNEVPNRHTYHCPTHNCCACLCGCTPSQSSGEPSDLRESLEGPQLRRTELECQRAYLCWRIGVEDSDVVRVPFSVDAILSGESDTPRAG